MVVSFSDARSAGCGINLFDPSQIRRSAFTAGSNYFSSNFMNACSGESLETSGKTGLRARR
jgi:hypothetical protein